MSVTWNAEEIMARLRAAAVRGVTRGGYLVEGHASGLITAPPKTGRVYRRRGVAHRASAPGEAPANDTGRLVGSGAVIVDPETITARVNWSTNYAEALEKGTERMEARPFARRALTEKSEEIVAAVADEMRQVFP